MKSICQTLCLVVLFGLLSRTAVADTHQIKLDVSSVHSVLKAGTKQTTWIRVGLKGFRLESDQKRASVNLAIVMDKSGSM